MRESFGVMKNAFLCVAEFARRPGDAIDSIITGGGSEAPLPPGASPAHPTHALLDSVYWADFFSFKIIYLRSSRERPLRHAVENHPSKNSIHSLQI